MKDSSRGASGPLVSTLGPIMGKPDKNILWEAIYGKCKELKEEKK